MALSYSWDVDELRVWVWGPTIHFPGDPLHTWLMTPGCRYPVLTKILGYRDYFQLFTKQQVCLDIPENLKLNVPQEIHCLLPEATSPDQYVALCPCHAPSREPPG